MPTLSERIPAIGARIDLARKYPEKALPTMIPAMACCFASKGNENVKAETPMVDKKRVTSTAVIDDLLLTFDKTTSQIFTDFHICF